VTRGVAPWLLGLAAFLLWPAPSALASEVRIEVSARQALVGEPFTVEVTAVLDGDDEAEEPKLPVQGKAEVAGPSLMPMRRMVMHNFNFRTERNLVATYEVTPTQTGRLVLGPASFEVGGKRLQTEALTVEVLDAPPPGSRRSRTLRGRDPFGFGFDPFSQDPFGRDPSGQGPFDGFKQRSPLSGYPEAPADLGLTSAPSETGFLMARLDKQAAWLGESVVLSIYAYGGRGAFRELSPTEPALADFLSYPSVETSHEQPFFRTEIAGREFLVVKLRELVLVSLRTGSLKIGPMRVILRGRGYPSQGSPLGSPAVSLPISLMVLPAPLVGRPPRFRAGDVGQFELSAEVTPREVQEQDFVSVKIQLSGRGNLPSTVEMPEVPGVAWGDPTVRGGVNVEGRELVGTRTLEYTAKLTRQRLAPALRPQSARIPQRLRSTRRDFGPTKRCECGSGSERIRRQGRATGPRGLARAHPPQHELCLATDPHSTTALGAGIHCRSPRRGLAARAPAQLARRFGSAHGPAEDEAAACGFRRAGHPRRQRRARPSRRRARTRHLLAHRGQDGPARPRHPERAPGRSPGDCRIEGRTGAGAPGLARHTRVREVSERRRVRGRLARRPSQAHRPLPRQARPSKQGTSMTPRFRMQGALLALLLCSGLTAASSRAQATDREQLLETAAAEIAAGQLDSAIGRLEAAADGGDVHPDAAFSRGVAYLRRALSDRAKPGDYGQAIAGFREALLLRPADGEASLAVEQTRLLVARRSANQGEQVLDTLGLRPAIDRSVAGILAGRPGERHDDAGFDPARPGARHSA
jgi:hypothetical protein